MTPASDNAPHVPVLLEEVAAALAPAAGETIVDATFGAGGYTRALLAGGATLPFRMWTAPSTSYAGPLPVPGGFGAFRFRSGA